MATGYACCHTTAIPPTTYNSSSPHASVLIGVALTGAVMDLCSDMPVLQELLKLILRFVLMHIVVPLRMAQPHRRYVFQSALVALVVVVEGCEAVKAN